MTWCSAAASRPAASVRSGRLVDQVMARDPYRSARGVLWVVDDGSSHRRSAAVTRLRDPHDNARTIHLPVHASWLQVEMYFSVVQRKALTPNDFTDLDDVQARLLAFQSRYEHTAVPLEW